MKRKPSTPINPDAEKMLETFRTVAGKVAGISAHEVLQQLVEAIADELQADTVFIGRTEVDLSSIGTVAQVVDGKQSEPFQYLLSGTPCEEVVNTGKCICGDNVAGRYSEDTPLGHAKIKGYVGTPLVNRKGKVAGVMVALFHRLPNNLQLTKDTLNLFTTRASAELERETLEHRLSRSEARYWHFFYEDLTGNYVTTPGGELLDANPEFLRLYGFKSLEQAQETDMSRLYPGQTDREHFLQLLKKERKLKDLESHAVRMDGTVIVVRENVVGEFDDEGELARIRGYIIDVTREYEAARELQDIREIIEESPTVIFVWRNEPGWPVEFVTENVSDLCGYTVAEFQNNGTRYADLIHPDDLTRVEKEVQQHSEDHTCQSFSHTRYRLIDRDGTIVWVDDRTVIQRDEEGNAISFRGVVFDVTERMNIERELAESRQRYLGLFETAPDAVFLMDAETGEVEDVNPAAERLLQRNRAEIIGMHQSQLYQSELGDPGDLGSQETVDRKSKSDSTTIWKKHVLRPDGSTVPVDVRAEMIDIGGRKLLQAVFRDVSEREEVEQQLRSSENQFRSLVEQAITGIYIIQDGLFRYVNQRFVDIFGYNSSKEIIDKKSVGDLVFTPDRELVVENVRKRINGEMKSVHYTFRGQRKDGSPVYVEVHGSSAEFLGKPSVIGTILDISERIRQEQELKENQLKLISAQQAAGLGFIEWDVENNCTYLSTEVIGILGMKCEEGWHELNLVTHLVHPDFQETVKQHLISSLKEDVPYQVEYKVIRPVDGKTIWVLGTGTVERNDEGRAARMVGSARDITKEKTAEIQIRASEEKFRALAESAPVAIIIYQEDGWVYTNPAASVFTGYSPQELYEMKWWNIASPEQRELVKRRGMARLAGEEVENRYELKIVRKDGEERWLDITGNLVEIEGEKSGLIVAIDVTDRKEIELRLRKDEARLKVLFDQSPVSLWEEDFSATKIRMDELRESGINDMRDYLHSHPETLQELITSVKITDVNKATLDMFHSKDKQHLLRNLGNVRHSEARKVWIEELCALYDGASEFSREGVARTLDGQEEIFGHWRFSVPEAYRESWERVLISITDISERYEMEKQLRESESKFRTLYEQSSVAFKVEDFSAVKIEVDGLLQEGMDTLKRKLSEDSELLKTLAGKVKIVSTNKAARDFLRVPSEKIESMSLIQQLTERSLATFGRQLIALLEGAKHYAGEGEIRTFDGELKYVIAQLSLIEKVEGTWDRMLISIVDLTEKKLLEEEQKKLEARLRQSQKLETVGTLAGGIAHDFNNILTPILGYSELARMAVPDDSPVADYLDRIETASSRARTLVKQMLAFSRQSEEEKVPMNLAPVVEEVVQLVRSSIPSTIEIQTDVDKDAGVVVADETQIHQVILNLCTNAAQAMPFGGVLTISLRKVEISDKPEAKLAGLKPGPYLLLAVRDTGTGMDEETLQRVFDPFFTTKEVGKGTGLGLSMVHGVAASHGGCCTADSELGEGSTFCVYLPVIESDTMQTSAKTLRETEEVVKGAGRVLIVDDDPDVLDLHREVLLGNGYQVRTFASSEAALVEVQTNPTDYDLIVTDLTMPGITGLQLAVSVYEVRSDLPVILVTGYREELTSDIRARTGIRKVLMKPVNIQRLSEAVREVLQGKP
jgi:PAS domain S-box-containing protein